ncbi:general secretion pathway protein GspK [Hyphomonas sp.]|uniref:general secretion pathway protein GspK n=1 Tax=Hyphomonas sp. TaxID=87 RepID=UPI0030028DFF
MLVIVAFASAMALTLMTVQDQAVAFEQKSGDRLQGQALLRGAEASVVSAFRRDGQSGSDVDHYGEAWYLASQVPIDLSQGGFSVSVRDEQSRFNINNLANGNLAAKAMFARIVAAVKGDASWNDRLVAAIALGGPISDMSDLAAFGFDEAEITALTSIGCALPDTTTINLNTASDALIRALFDNPLSAGKLLAMRSRGGYVTLENLSDASLLAPLGTGLTTQFISVEANVSWSSADMYSRSLLARRTNAAGVDVQTIRRITHKE